MSDPAWLAFVTEVPLEYLRSAGVAITPTGPGRWHAGMVHRAEGEPAALLDLANDHWLRNAPPSHRYAWIQLSLPAVRLPSVAAMCRLIAKRYASPAGGLPYAFRYSETLFSSDGQVLLGRSEHGLTCATFVLAVLRSVRVELLNVSEWPHREEDVVRHGELLAMLKSDERVKKEHIEAVAGEVRCVRFRPEEVAGAASSSRLPASFGHAEAAATQIVQAFATRAKGLTS
jgi:hypothetical protein